MRLWILGIVLGLALSVQGARAEAAISGAGVMSCSMYAKAFRIHPRETQWIFGAWAQGYMGGTNLTRITLLHQPGIDLAPPSLPWSAQQEILNEYCNAHPLAQYFVAVLFLMGQLGFPPPISR